MSENITLAISKCFQIENKIKKGEIYEVLKEKDDQINIRLKSKITTVQKNQFDIVNVDEILYKQIKFLINQPCTIVTIFPAIIKERSYQNQKYGENGNNHELLTWLSIIERELLEAKDEFFKNKNVRKTLQEILQLITVGVACLENNLTIERDNSSNFNDCYRDK